MTPRRTGMRRLMHSSRATGHHNKQILSICHKLLSPFSSDSANVSAKWQWGVATTFDWGWRRSWLILLALIGEAFNKVKATREPKRNICQAGETDCEVYSIIAVYSAALGIKLPLMTFDANEMRRQLWTMFWSRRKNFPSPHPPQICM